MQEGISKNMKPSTSTHSKPPQINKRLIFGSAALHKDEWPTYRATCLKTSWIREYFAQGSHNSNPGESKRMAPATYPHKTKHDTPNQSPMDSTDPNSKRPKPLKLRFGACNSFHA